MRTKQRCDVQSSKLDWPSMLNRIISVLITMCFTPGMEKSKLGLLKTNYVSRPVAGAFT